MVRFFTVHGPCGHPDMALFKFTKAILEGTPIDLYTHGNMRRDFTYVDDLVTGITRLIDTVRQRAPQQAAADNCLIEGLKGPLPRTHVQVGVQNFVDWCRRYYRV